MPIVDRSTRTIDLSNQGAALDAAVLERVRGALHLNDFFIHLKLSQNTLSDESVAMLCAILKDKTYLETLELRECHLTDKDFSLYLMPAIVARNKIKSLDLSKNDQITDSSVEALCKLIREVDLERLKLVGTSLSRPAGRRLALALEGNASMEVCDLPFGVGFDVLDRVALLLQRNINHKGSIEVAKDVQKEMAGMLVAAEGDARFLGSPGSAPRQGEGTPSSLLSPTAAACNLAGSPLADSPEAANERAAVATLGVSLVRQEQVALARYYTTKGRKNAVLAQPREDALPDVGNDRRLRGSNQSCGTTSKRSHRLTPGPSAPVAGGDGRAPGRRSPHGALRSTTSPALPAVFGGVPSLSSSAAVPAATNTVYAELRDLSSSFRTATDPAVSRALQHLRVLDDRCRAVELYQSALREERRHQSGLDVLPPHPINRGERRYRL